jgi:2,3-bisphosphoglycerate-dependent phosphoglycerate mutase
LVLYFDDIPDTEIPNLNIPSGIQLVYELRDQLRPIKRYYLGDPEETRKETKSGAKQEKAQK